MIRLHLKIRHQERLAGGFHASPLRLSCDEDGIQACECLSIIEPQHPTLVRFILVKESKAHVLFTVSGAPGLESHRLAPARLLVQVITVEYQRFVSGIEDPSERLVRLPILRNVVDIGNVKISGSDQVSYLSVVP